jgi:hypothetical protein
VGCDTDREGAVDVMVYEGGEMHGGEGEEEDVEE